MEKDQNKKAPFKEKYKQLYEVGAGTYGKVYKVSAENEKKFYALKKINYSKDTEGFPQTALREIKILKSLNHKNVIKLHDIITSKPSENNNYRGSTFLIFDYFEHDLWGLLKNKVSYDTSQLKCVMKQIFEGVEYLHSSKIIHRDLKSANILVSEKGQVQIADFGLARHLNSITGNYTSCVVTLWYRAPELLLGSKKYSTQVDVWSIGTIMAELLLGEPIFPGDKEPRQCELIFKHCGTPNESVWPGCKKLPLYSSFIHEGANHHERTLKKFMIDRLPYIDSITLDFLDKLLTLDPEKRLTAKEALAHEYFTKEPLPCEPRDLPKESIECHITLMSGKKKTDDEERHKKKKETERRNSYHNYHHHPPPPNNNPKSPEIEPEYNNYNPQYYSDTKARMPPIIQPEPPSNKPEPNKDTFFPKDESKKEFDILGLIQSGSKKEYNIGENPRKKIH